MYSVPNKNVKCQIKIDVKNYAKYYKSEIT